jgi:hypothetical protein
MVAICRISAMKKRTRAAGRKVFVFIGTTDDGGIESDRAVAPKKLVARKPRFDS